MRAKVLGIAALDTVEKMDVIFILFEAVIFPGNH
jgi:hypothetical protein